MRQNGLCRGIGLALATFVLLLAGCDRGKSNTSSKGSGTGSKPVEPTAPKPEYTFAAELEAEFPDVVSFLRHFLETALAGDYAGYRRLVSRTADPESRARFEKVLNALEALTVESIEEISLGAAPRAYRVIAKADLRPEARDVLRRRNNNRLAILVLEEEGELRMLLAPSELQPTSDESTPTTTPGATAPSYPWQRDGDY